MHDVFRSMQHALRNTHYATRTQKPNHQTGELAMATYALDELENRWARDELTAEQLLGHILQHLLRLEREQRQLKELLLRCAQMLKDQQQ
jgi:hypothetical protein